MSFPFGGGITPSSSSSASTSASLFADTSKAVQFGNSSSALVTVGAVCGVAALIIILCNFVKK